MSTTNLQFTITITDATCNGAWHWRIDQPGHTSSISELNTPEGYSTADEAYNHAMFALNERMRWSLMSIARGPV